MNWPYASRDPHAREEIGNRIAVAARKQELVNYSKLVRGVTFTLPNVEGGRPFQIDVADWTDLHRAIIGDFLGYLSAETYSHAGIFISSIVVTKDDGTPGYGFTEFMREIGVLTS